MSLPVLNLWSRELLCHLQESERKASWQLFRTETERLFFFHWLLKIKGNFYSVRVRGKENQVWAKMLVSNDTSYFFYLFWWWKRVNLHHKGSGGLVQSLESLTFFFLSPFCLKNSWKFCLLHNIFFHQNVSLLGGLLAQLVGVLCS